MPCTLGRITGEVKLKRLYRLIEPLDNHRFSVAMLATRDCSTMLGRDQFRINLFDKIGGRQCLLLVFLVGKSFGAA